MQHNAQRILPQPAGKEKGRVSYPSRIFSSLAGSVIFTLPRESCTILSFSKYFSIRDTTSLALPRFLAICSWVVESVREWVRRDSSRRYPARRLSKLENRISVRAHMASEKLSAVCLYT